MKTPVITVLVLAAAATGAFANLLPAGKDTKEIMIGVTGFFAAIQDGELRVTQVTPDTPAAGKLKQDDMLLAVNGESLQVQDPRHPLGFAINTAEGRDGKMEFAIERGGARRSVTLQLDPIGSYSPSYPVDCSKSQRIVDETAAFILNHGGPGDGINGNLEGLFLLSTGDEKYLPVLKEYAAKLASKPCGGSTWHIGYSGIFLGEYYLATGDKQVLPALKERCDALSRGQFYGGWGHRITGFNPGYVTGGVLNAAGDQGLTTLILARECGVEVDETTYNDALQQFSRFAGLGGVPYGDHHPELWWASNGKNGGLASALTLLPGGKFQGGAQLLALSETDSYWGCEGGHGSCFGNQTWRNIVDALVMETHPESWRRHKDEMIWFYQLSRMPGGGFRTPWFPGHGTIGREPLYQTGLIAMAYTAHLKNLRICGKPRTEFSVPHQPTALEASLPNNDFHRTDFIDGTAIDEEPHEIADVFTKLYDESGEELPRRGNASKNDERKKRMPAAWYAKMMRHYAPTVREWAAHGLGFLGEEAIPEITKALASDDARLRAAGFDAIACATGWSNGKTKSNITPEMIEEHFLPQILESLRNADAPMWEKRQALMALGCAEAGSIKENVGVIKPYLVDDEWWLRAAAFTAMHPLIPDTETIRSVLPAMVASYDKESRLASWRWGATGFFKKAIAGNPEVKDEIIAGMAGSLNDLEIREGFKRPIDENKIFETLRYVDMKKHPRNAVPILPSIERVYPYLEPLPARWTVTGARWGNIGLARAAELLGEEGAPFVESMKRIRPDLEARPKDVKHGKDLEEALDRMDEVVAAWEEKYGVVERRLSVDHYRDKMTGGWIGQMAGVGWGYPTEFDWWGEIIPEEKVPKWTPDTINDGFDQDDLYVEMTFLRTLEEHGWDVSIRQAGIDFANSGYRLWHANKAGRENLRKGIAPPDSGHPQFNRHADDIDYQIEADFAGLICPGMPAQSNGLGERFGRLVNYGDGIYGGQFVSGMYAEAFFEEDMLKIIKAGLACIPAKSQYAECIRDTIRWWQEHPDDWTKAWAMIEAKYNDNPDYRRFSCPTDKNIDAKLNGAYIVMGLLYGGMDMDRTIIISMRCGQDSDCNPSNAAGILGTVLGYEALPDKFKSALKNDAKFSHTSYTFPGLVSVCEKLTRQAVVRNGGKIERDASGDETLIIPNRPPGPGRLEQSWDPAPPTGSRFTEVEMQRIRQ